MRASFWAARAHINLVYVCVHTRFSHARASGHDLHAAHLNIILGICKIIVSILRSILKYVSEHSFSVKASNLLIITKQLKHQIRSGGAIFFKELRPVKYTLPLWTNLPA